MTLVTTMFRSSLVIVVATACSSSTQGARPHDMSAAQHDRAAEREDRTADAHASHYDPNATVESTRCSFNLPRPPICWTSVENPTAEHQRSAEEHRRRAADHRAASTALLDAETRTCIGISVEDRDTSPFDRFDDIASIGPLKEVTAQKVPIERTVGAVVTFRARPGLTAEWLQRVVDCHLARNAALGHVVPEMPNCPLVPKGVEARVTSTGNGFAVAIRSDDPAIVQEILGRARRSQSAPATGSPTR